MRLAITAIAALLLLIVTPSDAPARTLGRFLGPLAGPLNSILRGSIPTRFFAHRSRARYARAPAPRRSAIAQSRLAQTAQVGQLAQPEAFWPGAPQDVFDFVLSPREDGLWAHGYGAIVVSMFAQPPKKEGVAAGDQAAQQSEETVGAAARGGGPVCGEDRASHAEAITDWLRDTLALAGDQRVLTELRSALLQADNEITAACPRDIPSALPERLRVMHDRLWALRVAITNLRSPLQKFDDALTGEQKTRHVAQHPPLRESGRSSPASLAARLCYVQAQRAPQWPAAEIARAVGPDKDQQKSLAALSETSSKMSQLMMGACPQKAPATSLERLNVALDWLDTTLFAAVTIEAAVDDFYRSLSDEQKSRLDTLSL